MNLQRTLLHLLLECEPRLVREEIVYHEANLALGQTLTRAECRELLDALESKHQVLGQRGEDDQVRWTITALGKARLHRGDA